MSHYVLQREYAWLRHSIRFVRANPTWPTEWKQYIVLLTYQDYIRTGSTLLFNDDQQWELLKLNSMMSFVNEEGLVDWDSPAFTGMHFQAACHRDPAGAISDGYSQGSCDNVDWPPQTGFGGWNSYRDSFAFSKQNIVISSFAVNALRMLSEMASATNRSADAVSLLALSRKIAGAVNAHMYDTRSGLYCDGLCNSTATNHHSVHSAHYPLFHGLVPPERAPAVVAYLRTRGVVGSVYTTFHLLHGLYHFGSDDHGATALEVLTQCSNQSWCNMIKHNATTSWETWAPLGGTHSHPWSGSPASAIATGLMGIRPLTATYRSFEVKPQLGSGDFSANLTFPTIRGFVIVRTQQVAAAAAASKSMRIALSFPANMVARVCARSWDSADKGTTLTLDGKAVQSPERDGQYLCCGVGSGNHTVVSAA